MSSAAAGGGGAARRQCPSAKCGSFNTEATSEGIFCADCGTVIEDGSFDLSVSFTDNQDGSRSMNGQFVSNMCTTPYRLAGANGIGFNRESRDVTLQNGKKRIQHLAAALKLNHFVEAALRLFYSAVQRNFVHGRKTSTVVAACLYIVCRQRQAPHLLIDFSDVLQTNVYVLGNCFLKFRRLLNLQLPAIDPAHYIDRFAAKLEFDDKTHEVAKTAHKLVARMKRDWIQTGRRPSGVCGAALIIAARMHGFHRTQREVVNVMKICEETLRKRLVEFEATPSGSLTVEEFLQVELPEEANPPAFTRNRAREEKEAKELEDARTAALEDAENDETDQTVPLALLAEASTSHEERPSPATLDSSTTSPGRKRTRAEIRAERARAQEQLYSSLERELEQSLKSFEEEEQATAAAAAAVAADQLPAPATQTTKGGDTVAASLAPATDAAGEEAPHDEAPTEPPAPSGPDATVKATESASSPSPPDAAASANGAAAAAAGGDGGGESMGSVSPSSSTSDSPEKETAGAPDAQVQPASTPTGTSSGPSTEAEDDLLFQNDVESLLLKPDESRMKKVLWQVQNREYLEKERQDRLEGKVKRKRKRKSKQGRDAEGTDGDASKMTIPETNKRMSKKINYDAWNKLWET